MIAYFDVTGKHNADKITNDINTLIGINAMRYTNIKKGWYRIIMEHKSRQTIIDSFRLFAIDPIFLREVDHFKMGQVVMTANVSNWMEGQPHRQNFIYNCIQRHMSLDWGNVGKEDHDANDAATIHGDRIFSVYDITPEGRIWIITEADRSVTTILFPNDY